MNRQSGELVLIALLLLCGTAWGGAAQGDTDDISIEGQGNLRIAKKTDLDPAEVQELGKFRRTPRIVDKKVVFVDGSGNVVKERPLAHKEFGSKGKAGSSRLRKDDRQKPGGQQGVNRKPMSSEIITVKYENTYSMAGGQGIFIARWKEPANPDELDEDSPIDRTDIVDQGGNLIATIPGDYKLEAAPDKNYFVGVRCNGGLSHQVGVVVFFDKSGKQFAQEKIFEFGGMAHITISDDGEYSIVTLRAPGRDGKSGIVVFDKRGNLLWKKSEVGWNLSGPLDALRSQEGGEKRAFVSMGPRQVIVMSSFRDFKGEVLCFSAMDGKLVWTTPLQSSVMAVDRNWQKMLFLETNTGNLILVNPDTGEELSKIKSQCEGWPYRGDLALQIRDGLVLVKTGKDERGLEKQRCMALFDDQGKMIWKKAIARKHSIRPMADSGEDAMLLHEKRILLRDGAKQSIHEVGMP